MDSIISYIAESVFCGALFYILFVLLVSGKSSYNFQRGYLLISSFCTLVFPVLSIPVNTIYNFSIVLPEITIIGRGVAAGQVENIIEADRFSQLQLIYFTILSVFALIFVSQLFKILFIYLRGQKSRRGGIMIICSDKINSPFSLFNLVFICKGNDNLESECVITHERAHVKRGHSFDIILISAINAIQWFNPFIYFMKTSLVSVHEYQADKDVIMSGYTINYYQNLMLYRQFGVSPFVANRLNNSLTIKRLRKMKNLNEKRNRIITVVSVVLITSALFFFVSCKNRDNSDNKQVKAQQESEQPSTATPQAVTQVTEQKSKATPQVAKQSPKKPTPEVSPAKIDGEEVYMVVDVMPTFGNGNNDLFSWLSSNIKYPNDDKEKGIQGRVIAQFTVTKDGSVINPVIKRGVDPSLDKEALRVISQMPKWNPGKQGGKNVNVIFTLPIIFRLQ